MSLLDRIDAGHREHVRERLQRNQMAWLSTVSAAGQPEILPIWFLWRADETLLLYSRPETRKLANIAANPRVAVALDVTDFGRDTVRILGTAKVDGSEPPAASNPAYVTKYEERLAALFGDVQAFSDLFSVPLVISPARIVSPPPSPGVI